MWLRAHISLFAIGSVILLLANLLQGSGGVWADTAIGAWGVLLLAHGILLIIARLLTELLADDNEEIRPASEVHWSTPATTSTWSLPRRGTEPDRAPTAPTAVPPPPATPGMDPAEAAAAAAARERTRGKRGVSDVPPAAEPASTTPDDPGRDHNKDNDRVSWQAATDAAWLAPREEQKPAQKTDDTDDENDFTPLRYD